MTTSFYFQTSEAVYLAVAAAVLYGLYSWSLPKPIPGIPYNEEAAQSLLGDLPAMIRSEQSPNDWMLSQSKKLKSPVSQVFIRPFGKPFVLISDYRESVDIMMRRKEFDRSDFSFEILGTQFPDNHINMKTGPGFKAHRRLLQDLMTPPFLNEIAAPNIYASARNLIQLWEDKAWVSRGRPFSVREDIYHAGLDAVLDFTFADSFPYRSVPPQLEYLRAVEKELQKNMMENEDMDEPMDIGSAPIHGGIVALLRASDVVKELLTSPAPRWTWRIMLMKSTERQMIRDRDALLKKQIMKSVERIGDESAPRITSAIDMMMHRERLMAKADGRDPVYWSSVVKDEVLGFLIAGHETTSTALLWAFKFLADSQTSQIKLREALRSAHASAYVEKRAPTVEEITRTNIPYLDAIMEEVTRRSSTVSFLSRQCDRETSILGHHIPKDTIIVMFNRGPSFTEPGFQIKEEVRNASCQAADKRSGSRNEWDPENMADFVPERWLVEDEKGQSSFNASAGPTLAFSVGTRACWGRRLAYLEMRIIISLIFWNFELQPCPPKLSRYDAEDQLAYKPKQCFVRLKHTGFVPASYKWRE